MTMIEKLQMLAKTADLTPREILIAQVVLSLQTFVRSAPADVYDRFLEAGVEEIVNTWVRPKLVEVKP